MVSQANGNADFCGGWTFSEANSYSWFALDAVTGIFYLDATSADFPSLFWVNVSV